MCVSGCLTCVNEFGQLSGFSRSVGELLLPPALRASLLESSFCCLFLSLAAAFAVFPPVRCISIWPVSELTVISQGKGFITCVSFSLALSEELFLLADFCLLPVFHAL